MKMKKALQHLFNYFGYRIEKKSNRKYPYTKASKLLEKEYGHLKSKDSKQSVDASGEPIPWFTYPSIDFLKQLDFSNLTMLEWGAGNSSLYFSKRVKQLYSIEHNKDWYEQVLKFEIENQELFFASDDYAKKPGNLNRQFDIILIDGVKREMCADQSLKLIKEDGFIILDNSDRYPDIAALFRNEGFIEVDFHGFGPINEYTWTTSVFLQREVNFKPLTIQPTVPIGGGF